MPFEPKKKRHPDYDLWDRIGQFLWVSYIGGEEYQAADLLDRYPRESATIHNARKTRAYLLNYVAPVVDSYTSEIFKRDPAREVPDALSDFIEDATRDGETLDAFVRETMTRAIATERAFVVVDMSEEGIPYCHMIHPANLLDFSLNEDGFYNWALVAEKVVEDEDPFTDRAEGEQYRLWLPNAWQLYDKDGNLLDEATHSAGEVPIIPVTPGRMPLPMFDICSVQKRIYNYCSQIDEIHQNVTFPMFYYQPGELPPEDSDGETISGASAIDIGVAKALELPTLQEGRSPTIPGFIAPPEGPARLLMDEREKLIGAIHSLAGLENREADEVRVPESGVAKAYDFKEMNARLSAYAQAAEDLEMEIFRLVQQYGIGSTESNITYNKDFDVRAFSDLLDSYLKIASAPLPAEAKKRAGKDLVARIEEDASPEEQQEAIDAVEAMDDASFGGPAAEQQAVPTVNPLTDLLGGAA